MQKYATTAPVTILIKHLLLPSPHQASEDIHPGHFSSLQTSFLTITNLMALSKLLENNHQNSDLCPNIYHTTNIIYLSQSYFYIKRTEAIHFSCCQN